MYTTENETKKPKYKAMRTKKNFKTKTFLVKLIRNVLGTAAILNIFCILIYTMTPREIAIRVIEKSFYPPFISYYSEKYKDAKNSNQDVRDTYKKMCDERNELKNRQKELEEENQKAFNLFLEKTCDETLKGTNIASDRASVNRSKLIEKEGSLEEYKILHLNKYRENVKDAEEKLLEVFLDNMVVMNIALFISWIIAAIIKGKVYDE